MGGNWHREKERKNVGSSQVLVGCRWAGGGTGAGEGDFPPGLGTPECHPPPLPFPGDPAPCSGSRQPERADACVGGGRWPEEAVIYLGDPACLSSGGGAGGEHPGTRFLIITSSRALAIREALIFME